MTSTTVTHKLLTAAGAALARKTVTVELVVPGYDTEAQAVVLSATYPTTDTDGSYSVDLTPNTELEPTGTYYLVTHPGQTPVAIVVPVSDEPVWLFDCLVDDPALPDGVVVGVSSAELSTALQALFGVFARLNHKEDVGLDLVDDTADLDKPISTAVQAALDAAADDMAAAVDAAVTALLDGAPGALDTLNELAAALGDDASFAATVTAALAAKAPLDSPALTGTPTAPTPSGSDSSTKLATTAFVSGNYVSPAGKTTTTAAAPLPFFNVKDYGAKGDNSTDDTAAIQAAVDAIPSTGGTVLFPGGRYVVTGTVTIPNDRYVRLVGSGMGQPSGKYGTKIKRGSGTSVVFSATASGSSDVTFDVEHMEISGNGTAGALVQITNGAQCHWYRVRLSQATGTMLHLTRGWNCSFTQCFFYDNNTGTSSPVVLVDGSADGESNTVHFALCEWEKCYTTNLKIASTSGFGAQFVNVNNSKWEAHGPDPLIWIVNGQGCQFTDCFVYAGVTGDTALLVKQDASGSSPVRSNGFTNTTFSHVGTAAPYFVEVNGGILQMTNCGIDGTPTSKYFHVGSAAPDNALKLVNLAVPTASLMVQDDRATAATTARFGTVEGNSEVRGTLKVYNPASGAGSGQIFLGTAASIYADGTNFFAKFPGNTLSQQLLFEAANSSLLAAVNGDGSLQPSAPGTGTLGARVYSGTSAPAFSATAGDLYIRTDGATALALYRCTTSSSATSGAWTALLTLNPFGFPYTVDPGQLRSSDFLGLTANSAMYARVRDGGTISKIALRVGASSGNVSVAAYSNSGTGRAAVPGTLLSSSGAVACPAIGYAEISLGATVTLQPGDWLGFSANNATATINSLLTSPVATNLGLGREYTQTSAHPLPSTPSSLVASIGNTHCLIGVA